MFIRKMKKLTAALILITILNCALFAQNAEAAFSINPNFGIAFENHGEYIYSPSGRKLYSYLEYQVEPLFTAGLLVNGSFGPAQLSFGADIAFPGKCGTMYDSDWNLLGVKTTYSIHENNAQQNYDFFMDLGWAFRFGRQNQFGITPKMGILYCYDSFFAQNGYGWYGGMDYSKNGEDNSWDSEYARKAKKLYPIELARRTFYTFLGFDFSANILSKLDLTAGSYISPYTRISSTDHHHSKPDTDNDFYINEEQACAFLRFKETLNISYALTSNLNINLSGTWIFGPISKGPLYDFDELTTQISGSDVNEVFIKLGLDFKF